MANAPKPKKVLVIGSGPIIIGQAAEFDYAGAQACKSLREEGVITVLVNSNPATIMTDEGIADIVYIEPLTIEVIERIIAREKPDGLLPTMGGQTGLNLAVQLAEHGILDKYGVRLLGTPLSTIQKAEDRDLFKRLLIEIGEPVPPSRTVGTIEEAREVAKEIGLPLVVRPAFTLGGTGSGFVRHADELERMVGYGLSSSPIHQVLLEKSLEGWKEIEYEVMRDGADNCIIICNMENLDPMGVHTGDSIVVAPSQTLTDKEYQMLRTASIHIIRELGVEGGCNVQYALAPNKNVIPGIETNTDSVGNPISQYYVIEVNPRVSRSSALASKATGYPIARVSAKIAAGKRLDEIPNAVTKRTVAAFEPALDYCVVKIPRWPFDKFASGDRTLGTQMKSTGEVMAIDRSFEAAFQKAVRSLDIGEKSLLWEAPEWKNIQENVLYNLPLHANDLRIWAIMAALRKGATPMSISLYTKIDPWFINRLNNILKMQERLLKEPLTHDLMWQAKRFGFSDEQIGQLADRLPEAVRTQRKEWGIKPVYKMVDTCAAEFVAETPYFYSTYEQENEAPPLPGRKAIVIGSGPIRIGQGIEFDYCSVHAAWAFQEENTQSILVNSNPETVSTDFDTSTRLYFEPLDEESIRDIIDNESSNGADQSEIGSAVQFGGQTAINLSQALAKNNLTVLGSSAEAIDMASDRGKFEGFLTRLGIPMPPGAAIRTVPDAIKIAAAIGYPVLVRPSYVLGGRAMEIVNNDAELSQYLNAAISAGLDRPILVDKYLLGKEIDVDAVSDGESVLIPGIMEHIERAGVHSGDAMTIYPGIGLTTEEVNIIVDYTERIGRELKIKGLMNVQAIVVRNAGQPSQVYIIEVNPRASRTVPFISKLTDAPMVRIASKIMLGKTLKEQGYKSGLLKRQGLVGIKAPVFSMSKLGGVDTYLGPEMKSTGEVMGIDYTYQGALTKALIAAGMMLPDKGGILVSIADRDKAESIPIIRKIAEHGYKLYATEGTADMLQQNGLTPTMITKKLHEGHPNVVDVIRNVMVHAVINTVSGGRTTLKDGFEIRRAAAEMRIPCYTSLDTARVAIESLSAGRTEYNVLRRTEYLNGSSK